MPTLTLGVAHRRKSFFRRLPLGALRRFTVVTALALAIAGSAVLGVASAVRSRLLEDAGREEIMVARLVSQQIDQTIRTAKIVTAMAAKTWREASDPDDGARAAVVAAAENLALEPQFLALKIIDANGQFLAASSASEAPIGNAMRLSLPRMLESGADFELSAT